MIERFRGAFRTAWYRLTVSDEEWLRREEAHFSGIFRRTGAHADDLLRVRADLAKARAAQKLTARHSLPQRVQRCLKLRSIRSNREYRDSWLDLQW
jgi:hypothetical protein